MSNTNTNLKLYKPWWDDIPEQDRRAEIAKRAYLKWAANGYYGDDVSHWLEAEKEYEWELFRNFPEPS